MRFLYFLLLFCLYAVWSNAQVRVPVKVDTTKQEIRRLYNFVNTYMQQDTISNEMWHPKYRGRKIHDYTMDWTWGQYTPKQIMQKFDLSLAELQRINDTLSYVKILTQRKAVAKENSAANVYKFYIVKIGGQYYLDNCKDYDSKRFSLYKTKNLHFYISPFYQIDAQKMKAASIKLEALYALLKRPHLKKPIAYFMCAEEEELNNLSNIVIWDGGLGGFTNIPEGYVVAINDDPMYSHEFIHAILGSGANCFFLQEGIASLYGGMEKGKSSFEKSVQLLAAGYEAGKYTFDDLYYRRIKEQYNSNLTYTFAAVCCKYLIDTYGLDYFYQLYYDTNITTDNFLEAVVKKTGKSKAETVKAIENVMLAK